MAVKWSTPGIGFSEIDNSIQANTTTADGVGAIVLRSNQGYVNQRILSTSRKRFHEQFGDQETSADYGHFAADQYLAVSPQLYAVRATMGDEGYGFIQFPYTDASIKDSKYDPLQQSFEYIDTEGNTNITLLGPLGGHVELQAISGEKWNVFTTTGYQEIGGTPTDADLLNTAFCLVDSGSAATFRNLAIDDSPELHHIFRGGKNVSIDESNQADISGLYVHGIDAAGSTYSILAGYDLANGVKENAKIDIFSDEGAATAAADNKMYGAFASTIEEGKLSAYKFTIPSLLTLNKAGDYSFTANLSADVSFDEDGIATATFTDLTAMFASAESDPCMKLDIEEWDTADSDVYYVKTACIMDKAATEVSGLQYREITGALYNQSLATCSATTTVDEITYLDKPLTDLDDTTKSICEDIAKAGYKVYDTSELSYNFLLNLAREYGKDISTINTSAYKVLGFLEPRTCAIDVKICFAENPKDKDNSTNEDGNKTDGVFVSKWIFNSYYDEAKQERIKQPAYISFKPKPIYVPWQYEENSDDVAKLVAYPSSEVFNDPSGIYKDGYTKTILTQDEPGNGDIERYVSKQNNQLVIAAVGPGEYGNDIGISIITPEVAGNMALENEQAAFNWKYQFDDEDLVDRDWQEHPSYKDNPNNLTWKKVYKINVYVKTKTQQASVWGTGLDALARTPVESFLVSNDPSVKDGMGNSMYAPYVINGQSKYIYVSLNSVIASRTAFGDYAMPKQTYSIYQLKGGCNSKLDNIREKTAALELYRDRQKCMFDIIFNVDAIESFQSKQKYAAHQNKIAEIASERGMDIGFIQVTSKAARTGQKALSEGKLFTFSNGSYVACQAGYDRYYDSYTSNWVYLPKSVAYAVAHARCWVQGTPWFAPAGIKNGTIDYSSGQLLKLSDTEIGQLYDANINCSRTCASYGEVNWCQKTALKKTSALNRINVRGLINYIEKNLDNMLVQYLYQNNTANTRSSIRATVDSFLSGIMAEEGIIAKSVVVKPDPDDAHLIYVNIQVIPAEAIEFIQVTTTINRQNASISSTES